MSVIWCDRGILPTWFGFCPDEASWHEIMDQFKIKDEYPNCDGKCNVIFRNEDDKIERVFVTIGDYAGRDAVQVIGILVHEATHVWQYIKRDIGEKEPSAEFECYMMQHIVQELLKAFRDTRMSKVRSNAKPDTV